MENLDNEQLTPEPQEEVTATESGEVATEKVTDTANQEVIAALNNELAAQKDKYLRLYSEFDNFRKRTSREKIEMIQSANEGLIKNLLPILDDIERAEKVLQGKEDQESTGVILIFNKFRKILDQTGIKPMETLSGTAFNPDLHEAITQIPAPEESLKGKIIDTVEKGFTLNEKVVRFAKVVVGS